MRQWAKRCELDDAAARHFERAARALDAARAILLGPHVDFAAGRAYYAMLHTASALLVTEGIRRRKHSAVHAEFGRVFVVTGRIDRRFHRWLIEASVARIADDYGEQSPFTADEIAVLIRQAEEFLSEARRMLSD